MWPSRIDFGLSGPIGEWHLRCLRRTLEIAGGDCILNSVTGVRSENDVGPYIPQPACADGAPRQFVRLQCGVSSFAQ